MRPDTVIDALTGTLGAPATRRTVVKTAAKLSYAVPLVAASFKLSAHGALAACGGDTPYPFVFDGESLCCGCCEQTGGAGDAALGDAFVACQQVLVDNGVTCPLADEPGGDARRVCLAQNVASL